MIDWIYLDLFGFVSVSYSCLLFVLHEFISLFIIQGSKVYVMHEFQCQC
jgi:hypothetical protein